MKKMSDYRNVIITCSCYDIDHMLKFDYWDDDNLVYITSPMKIDNIWRRFGQAIRLIVWGEAEGALDMLVNTEQMQKLNGFVRPTVPEMMNADLAKEKEHERKKGGGP